MSQSRRFLFVTVRRDDKVNDYVENWWTHVHRVQVTSEWDMDVWRSDRTGSAAALDAEVALGRLGSGLYFGSVVEMEDDESNIVDFHDAWYAHYENVRSLSSAARSYGATLDALRALDEVPLSPGDAVFARTDVYGVAGSTVDAEFVADNGDGTVTLRHRSGDEFIVPTSEVARA